MKLFLGVLLAAVPAFAQSFAVSPTSLSFSPTATQSQPLTVWLMGGPMPKATITPSQGILVNRIAGPVLIQLPLLIDISIDPALLPAGAAQGSVTISVAGSAIPPLVVPIRFGEPRIIVESLPELGTASQLVARVEGLPPFSYNAFVAWFVPDAGWSTPNCVQPSVDSGGRFSVVPTASVVRATKILIAAVPTVGFTPCLTMQSSVPESMGNVPVRIIVNRADPAARIIQFSGRSWKVKDSGWFYVGPGPNQFSSSAQNVWVDEQGRLHLRITPCGAAWCSAEVISAESFGYGEYKFVLDTPLSTMHPNAVLGMFTWSEDASYNHREIDIELTRWRNTVPTNAQFVVQPYTTPGNMLRFDAPTAPPSTTWLFDWAPQSVQFEGRTGAGPFQQYTVATPAGIPPPGDERVRINLYWAFGQPGNLEQEVVIRSFTFTPSTRMSVTTGTLDLQRIPAAGIPSQRLTVNQPGWAFQTPLPAPFQPFPLAGTGATEVWFTVHPNWQPRDRAFTAQPGAATLNFTQLGHPGTREQRMMGMLYYSFLSRLATPEEVDFQVTQALHKGTSPGVFADSLFNSPEFNEYGRFAAGLYVGLLDRDPDYQGWRFQSKALVGRQVTQTALVGNFLDSAEFRLKWGTLTDADFVRLLYRQILLREATAGEVTLQTLETGRVGRVEMARRFLTSPEFRIGAGPRLTAFLLYATLLNREASQADRDGWAAQIRGGLTIRAAIDAFMATPEFPLAFN